MEQLASEAVMKDATTKASKEESVCGMGLSKLPIKSLVKQSAMKDAPTLPRKEKSVGRKLGRDDIHITFAGTTNYYDCSV
mmetsp:Transcript_28590/g.52829  ORF Transcript_28590/g.52829 Transcript_28590/m.52829 type:complete len:80 (-) Transcript_28590:31-270(-)